LDITTPILLYTIMGIIMKMIVCRTVDSTTVIRGLLPKFNLLDITTPILLHMIMGIIMKMIVRFLCSITLIIGRTITLRNHAGELP
jgi:uncharacterized membrane protein YhdT